MIAQLILTTLLAVVLLYAWIAYRQSPIVGTLAMLAALAGMYFVWVPSHAMIIAAWAGIGRGVDLIIYTWVVISLIFLLNLHLKLRTQTELVTKLTRAIAIAEASRRR
jgi:small membrane protein